MFSFTNYTNEIFTVSKEKGVDIGVAYDMFRADIRAGEAKSYNTGTALPDFDFAALKAEWDTLAKDEQKAACEEWHNFIDECYAEICTAFAEGEDAVIAVVGDWGDEHEDN